MLLDAPDHNDYLTDEESDGEEFAVKIPDLDALINQFENTDESILKFQESQKEM